MTSAPIAGTEALELGVASTCPAEGKLPDRTCVWDQLSLSKEVCQMRKWKWILVKSESDESELLLKSSGGRPGEAAEEEEDRQQWWSPVGRQVFYFAFSWQLILLFWGAFVLNSILFLISMVRWFLLRADHCLYSFKSDQVNVLKIFCHFLAATRVGPGHFFKYIIYDKI